MCKSTYKGALCKPHDMVNVLVAACHNAIALLMVGRFSRISLGRAQMYSNPAGARPPSRRRLR